MFFSDELTLLVPKKDVNGGLFHQLWQYLLGLPRLFSVKYIIYKPNQKQWSIVFYIQQVNYQR